MTPLRRKIQEDMQLRDLAEKTREAYLAAVKGLRVIQELLGHKSPQTTAVYTHLTDRSLDRLGAALDEIAAGL